MAQGSCSNSGTSSRRHPRNDQDTNTMSSSRFPDTEWEAKEALRQRELEEARARATQMEKTMRWWSDCTANWREKWSKVRNERNKAREEAKMLRTKLEASVKDTNLMKREKLDLETKNEQLKLEMERIHALLLKHAGQWDQHILEALENRGLERVVPSGGNDDAPGMACFAMPETAASSINDDLCSLPEREHSEGELENDKDPSIEEYVLQGALPKHAVEMYRTKENPIDGDSEETSSEPRLANGFDDENGFKAEMIREASLFNTLPLEKRSYHPSDGELSSQEKEHILQKLSMLQLRLDEASKTIQAEREEKTGLHRGIERLQGEVQELKERCEDLRTAKQNAVRELLQLQDQHQDQVRLIQLDLQDEASSREGMDRRLADLRTELEALQVENAAEWGKRERLETEKISLERDNKKLRAEVRDLQERMERKGRPLSTSDTDVRQLQQDLADRNKELSDLRHTHGKLKKVLQDKSTELAHAVRRAEQYETEVKRLRGRVEELKRELALAEDDVDSASNTIRKLQRSNDELQEQLEGLHVQVDHLQTRLRMVTSSSLLSLRGPTLLDGDGSDDDGNDY